MTTNLFPTFKDVDAGVLPGFQIEQNYKRGMTYFTPYTQDAKDWAARNLRTPMHGRSYFFPMVDGKPSEASSKLKSFIRREGFTVSR